MTINNVTSATPTPARRSLMMQLVDQAAVAAAHPCDAGEELAARRHDAICETISTMQAETLKEAEAQLIIAAGNAHQMRPMWPHEVARSLDSTMSKRECRELTHGMSVEGYRKLATQNERLIRSALAVVQRLAGGAELTEFARYFLGGDHPSYHPDREAAE
jgi:hypothetical protein